MSKLKNYLSLAAFFLIVVFIVYYIKSHWSEFQDIRITSWFNAAILFIIAPINILIQGLFLKVLMEPFGVKLKFNEWLGLMVLTLLGNILIPFGGLGFRAAYLKKYYNFGYTDFLSTTVAVWLISYVIFTIGGIIGLIFLYWQSKIMDFNLMVIFGVILLGCLIVWFFPFKISSSKNKIIHYFSLLIKSWQFIKSDKFLVKRLIQLITLQLLVLSSIFFFAYQAFDFKVNFIGSFLPACLSLYTFFIRIVPASLGIYEIAVIYPSQVLGLNVAQGLSVAFLTRIAIYSWIFVLGLIFGYILLRKNSKKKTIS